MPSWVKIEEIVDYEKSTNEKRVKKKKSQSSMPKGNDNSNNQIVAILESEDEEGFHVHAHDKKSGVSKSNLDETKLEENIGQKSQNKSADEQPARETEPHCSDQHHTTEKEVNRKKNKKKSDTSLEYGKPDSVGAGQFLKGWDVGIDGMRVGGKRRLTIPREMGFGAKGVPPEIPPNACLVYDLQLIKVTK